jgi:hypothetical protein
MGLLTKPQRHRKPVDESLNGADLERIYENLDQFFQQFASCPLMRGNTVDVETTGSGDFRVVHQLGRYPQGYLVIESSCAPDLYIVSSDKKYLTLNTATAGNQTWTLWVF